MLTKCSVGGTMKEFQSKFNIKDAIWSSAEAWNKVDKNTLTHGRHHLWPSLIFLDDDVNEEPDFECFSVSRDEKIVTKLMTYAKGLSCPEAK